MIKVGFTSYSFASALRAGTMDIAEAIRFAAGIGAKHMEISPGNFLAMTPENIDLIVRTGLTEVPVVDKEGELTGVASADEVLRLCIPDYLLWMEDLSGFSNFEPFAALLRKEASTWLADIMSDEDASVSVDQPAIAVAEAFARKDASICYVLDDGKLVGVVTLPHFLNKVFRD